MDDVTTAAATEPDLSDMVMQTGLPAESVKKVLLVKRLLDSQAAPGGARDDKGKARLVQHVRRLQAEHERMQARLDALAEALGACYCWGEDEGCRGCSGKGVPGALPADPERFDEFVLPLLIRIGLVSEDGAPVSPRTNDQ